MDKDASEEKTLSASFCHRQRVRRPRPCSRPEALAQAWPVARRRWAKALAGRPDSQAQPFLESLTHRVTPFLFSWLLDLKGAVKTPALSWRFNLTFFPGKSEWPKGFRSGDWAVVSKACEVYILSQIYKLCYIWRSWFFILFFNVLRKTPVSLQAFSNKDKFLRAYSNSTCW